MELTEDEIKRAYQSILNQRERARRNYQNNRDLILLKRKEHREKKFEGQVRNPVGRPRKVCEVETKTN